MYYFHENKSHKYAHPNILKIWNIINTKLFSLALDKLQPSDWKEFEDFVPAFLISEFPNLRTMAYPSGDGGRDSELFSPEGKTFIAFQYSIQKDWRSKIFKTIKRLKKEFPSIRILVYLTNQQIGAQADPIKSMLLEDGVSLDIRDRNWFVERVEHNETRKIAANKLIEHIARPYLVGEQVINKPSSALTSQEARAALLYLGLQWKDDISEKSLTKLSFDALVRAALRPTDSENRLTRIQIYETIQEYLPSVDKAQMTHHVDSALTRLTKKYIRHWQKNDEFCLTHEEHQRILIRLSEKENEEAAFYDEVEEHCYHCLEGIKDINNDDFLDLKKRIPRIIEKLLLQRGEVFVSAVTTNNLDHINIDQLKDVILSDLSSFRPRNDICHYIPKIIETIVYNLFSRSKESSQNYLRWLANSYTLFSFLRETPDVQRATNKLFSYGTVWLDTSVLLPIFAEQLEDDEKLQRFTQLIKASNHAGMKFCASSLFCMGNR